MPDFTQKLRANKEWVSSSFYAFPQGYLMFLKVYAAGMSEGRFVSVQLVLMKGPYDDELEKLGYWPMCGKFEIKLLNQVNDRDHHTVLMSDYNCITDRVTKGYVDTSPCTVLEFISHYKVFHGKARFLENDNLYFKVTYHDTRKLDIFFILIIIVLLIICCTCICCKA